MDLKKCLLFSFFCVVILAPFSIAEHFEVNSPPSVVGNVGQDAVLPCQISLKTQPYKMEVKWERIGDKHIDNIYHFATVTGQETFGSGYQGKIGLLKEDLGTGNVSLKLKKVQVNDEGIYRCIVKSSDWISQTQTVLSVAAFGNVSIEVLGPEGEGIKLVCKSSGWFPEPELQWLTKDPHNPQEESNQDHEQLFSVSSSITVLRDSGEITCSVHPRNYLTRKWESTILLARDIFPHPSLWSLAFFIILAVLAVVVLAFFIYKVKLKVSQRKYKEQKNQLEDKGERNCGKGEVEEELIQGNVQDKIKRFEEKEIIEFLEARFSRVNMILDDSTAHPRLEVSEDGKRVRDSGNVLSVPNNEERFDSHMFVLAKEGFVEGKHYWEVDVGQKTSWDLGVASESICRKGKIKLAPQNGFWVIGLDCSKDYWARTDPWILLGVNIKPTKIGMFLNMPEKSLTFYDVNRRSKLHTYSFSNPEKFYPFLSVGSVASELDSHPLIITSCLEEY